MKGLSVLDRLYPESEVNYRGVTITITPLPFAKVPKLIRSLWSVIPRISSGSLSQDDIVEIFDDIVALLDECVKIQEDESIKVKQLPLDAIPDIMQVFLEQSFKWGKWEALLERANDAMTTPLPTKKES